jgi:uncharacterized membrane protein YsdA (DUF1294 family)
MCCFGVRVLILLFIVAMSYLLNAAQPQIPVLFWYAGLINIFSIFAMGVDKYQATRDRARIPEPLFTTLSIVGGVYGIWFGAWAFRHKNRKASFVLIHAAIATIWLILIILANSYGFFNVA